MSATYQGPYADVLQAAGRIYQYTKDHDGGTFTRTGEPVGPIDAWAVGGKEPGRVYDRLAAIDIAIFLQQVPVTDAGTYVGTWLDDGKLYLDTVSLVPDEIDAIALAADRGERCIYHLGRGESYYLQTA